VNWPDLIFDLLRAGLSEARIAAKIGASGCAVNKLKNGHIKEPRYGWGVRLVNLHESYKRGGFIHDREQARELGAALENGVSQTGDDQPRGQLQAT
jgi:hypothetical protein